MKRTLILVATILATAVLGVETLVESFTLILLIPYFGPLVETGYGSFLIVLMLIVAIIITALILNACSISSSFKDVETFKKKKKILITSIVFNFLVIILLLVALFGPNYTEVSVFSYIIVITTLLSLIAAIVLIIVDLCKEKNRTNAIPTTNENIEIPKQEPVKLVETNSQYDSNVEEFEKRIKKLNSMKENGLIDEKEYSEIKKKYIKEHLDKK